MRSALEAGKAHFGRLDAVINNAGRGLYASVTEMDTQDWQDLWAVNVQGALYVMQESVPLLTRGGVLVNVSSIVAKVATPYMGGYSASKAALSALSDALRIEQSAQGIRVITVYPGSTETEFRQKAPGWALASEKRIVRVSADRVAQVIVEALTSSRSRVWVTWRDRLAAALALRFPTVSDWVLRRYQCPKRRGL